MIRFGVVTLVVLALMVLSLERLMKQRKTITSKVETIYSIHGDGGIDLLNLEHQSYLVKKHLMVEANATIDAGVKPVAEFEMPSLNVDEAKLAAIRSHSIEIVDRGKEPSFDLGRLIEKKVLRGLFTVKQHHEGWGLPSPFQWRAKLVGRSTSKKGPWTFTLKPRVRATPESKIELGPLFESIKLTEFKINKSDLGLVEVEQIQGIQMLPRLDTWLRIIFPSLPKGALGVNGRWTVNDSFSEDGEDAISIQYRLASAHAKGIALEINGQSMKRNGDQRIVQEFRGTVQLLGRSFSPNIAVLEILTQSEAKERQLKIFTELRFQLRR